MSRMDLLFRFPVFRLTLFLFKLDDVETKLALDHVADLTWLQSVSSLLKLRNHVATSKPTEITTFVLAAVTGELLRQFAEVFTGACALQNFFRGGAVLFVGVELRMAREIRRHFLVSCFN